MLALPKLYGTIIALIAAVAGALTYPSSYRKQVDKRLRALYQKSYPAVAIHQWAVELTAAGIEIKQNDRQTLYQWASIEEIVITEDSVDFFTRDGLCGWVVRKSAFQSLAEQWQFVELAQQYLEQASQAQPVE